MMSNLKEYDEITKVTVVAVPLQHDKEQIKLVSINEFQMGSNGFKQFDINIKPLSSGELSETCSIRPILCGSQSIQKILGCGNLSFVTSLKLRNCGLSHIPKELHIFPLKELDLSCNLMENIPECLYFGLHDLEVLNLSSNLIKMFRIPPKCVEKLKVLDLDDCKFEEIPPWIQEMKAIMLEELYFSRNTLQNCTFNWVRRSHYLHFPVRLRKIIFNNTGVFQNMLVFFGSFQLLQYLDLSDDTHTKLFNSVLDINKLVQNASWVQHIQVLKLRKLCIPDLSDNFTKLVKLKVLDLRDNRLWDLPDMMCNLKHLVVLDVSHNRLYILPDLSALQMLEELHLAKNFVTNVTLINMPRLKYLDLYDNDLEYLELSLGSLRTIEYMDLEKNSCETEVLLTSTDIPFDNYKDRRESLRVRGQYKCREIGRKLRSIELDSPTEDDVDSKSWNGLYEDQNPDCSYELRYSDNGDEGGAECGKGGTDTNNTIEDLDSDDWSDLEVVATLSDTDFLPEEVSICDDAKKRTAKATDVNQSLFIDAD